MAGGTSGFDMINSTKNNRNLRSGRTKMSDNPYNQTKRDFPKRNPGNCTELIEERFDRKAEGDKLTVTIYVGLTFLIGVFFYMLMVGF
ncbi:hypothetical protein MM213_14280 [Belliella sp. R4-6]|uniref:Uncharacterized protein n=1 Tax=Belliella alkalica TaxID=1730871 RepID=A0ABS9VDY9_9BACT|nr:hypothetical protein [Belliella alkalica]MCH7414664.1 hypothetical protein [Belliella alkalica]